MSVDPVISFYVTAYYTMFPCYEVHQKIGSGVFVYVFIHSLLFLCTLAVTVTTTTTTPV